MELGDPSFFPEESIFIVVFDNDLYLYICTAEVVKLGSLAKIYTKYIYSIYKKSKD